MFEAILLAVSLPVSAAPQWIDRTSWVTVEEGTVYLWAVGVVEGIENHSLARTTADNRARATLCALVAGAEVHYTPSALRAEGHAIESFSRCDRLNWATVRDHYMDDANGRVWSLARGKLLKPDLELAAVPRDRPADWRTRGPAWTTKVGDHYLVLAVGHASGIGNIALRRSTAGTRATAALCEHLWHHFHPGPTHGDAMPRLAFASCSVDLVTHEAVQEVDGATYSLAAYVVPPTMRPIAAVTDAEKRTALASSDPQVRARGAWLLGATKTPKSADALLDALAGGETPELRHAVAWSLGALGGEATGALIERLLATRDAKRTFSLIQLIQEAGTPLSTEQRDRVVLPRLMTLANDGRREVRLGAYRLLSEMPEATGVVRAMIAGIDDRDSDVRAIAFAALAEIHTPEVREKLTAKLGSRDAAIRRSALVALLEHPGAPETAASVLDDRDAGVLGVAIGALSPTQAGIAPALLAILENGSVRSHLSDETKTRAVELIGAANDSTQSERAARLYVDLTHEDSASPTALSALGRTVGRLGDAKAVELLTADLSDPRRRARVPHHLAGLRTVRAYAALFECSSGGGEVSEGCRQALFATGDATMLQIPGIPHAVVRFVAEGEPLYGAATVELRARAMTAAEEPRPLDAAWRSDLLAMTFLPEVDIAAFAIAALATDDDPEVRARIRKLALTASSPLHDAAQASLGFRDLASVIAATVATDDAALIDFVSPMLRERFRRGLGYATVSAWTERQQAGDWDALERLRQRVVPLSEDTELRTELEREMRGGFSVSARLAAAELLCVLESQPAVVDAMLDQQGEIVAEHLSTDAEDRIWPHLAARSEVWRVRQAARPTAAASAGVATQSPDSAETPSSEPNTSETNEAHSVIRPEPLTIGRDHTCALAEAGRVVCWGHDGSGQATPPDRLLVSLAAGDRHTCGLDAGGSPICWGAAEQTRAPDEAMTMLAAGASFTCGLTTGGAVVCWGDQGVTAPAGEFSMIAAGAETACGARADGTIVCWGHTDRSVAKPPPGPFDTLSLGGMHACGVRRDGEAVCWGWSKYGQAALPDQIDIAPSSLSAGAYHTCLLDRSGRPHCWGYDHNSRLDVADGAFVLVRAGVNHSCGIRSDGAVACWGDDADGQCRPPDGFRAQSSQ